MINGVSIKEIERRCIPLEDNSKDPFHRSRAATGFLSENETLLEVIKADFCTLNSIASELGVNKCERVIKDISEPPHPGALVIAKLIKEIIRQTESLRAQECKGPMADVTIIFDSQLPRSNPQKLTVGYNVYAGFQYSPFYNYDDVDATENITWNDEYHIKNTFLGFGILVGGGSEKGVVSLIEQHGFFEGNKRLNPYRIDPLLFLTLCTGTTTNSAKSNLVIYLNIPIERAQLECMEVIAKLNSLKETVKDEEFLAEIEAEKERVISELKSKTAIMNKENVKVFERFELN